MLRRDFGIADIDRFLDQHLFPSTLSPYDGALFQPDAIYTCYARSISTQRRRDAETQRRRDAEESAEKTKPRHPAYAARVLNASGFLCSSRKAPPALSQMCSLRLSLRLCASALNSLPHGRRITFIKFGSWRYSRSNHLAPSSSGATALISPSTWIAPRDIISIHAGYSPFEAHDPRTRICRDTTDCSGNSIWGDTFPTSVTAPPLRTPPIAVRIGSVAPTHSHATSAPRPPVAVSIASTAPAACGLIPSVAPAARASFSRPSSGSTAITRLHPAIRAA